MNLKQKRLTKDELKELLFSQLKTNIKQVRYVKKGTPIEVWNFTSDEGEFYMKIAYNGRIFMPEKWVLEKLAHKGVSTPRVILCKYEESSVNYPFIILSEIKGKPLEKVSLSKEEKESIAYQLGKDLAKINSIKTENFGWCSDELSKENHIVTGYDSSSDIIINIALTESLPYLLENRYLRENEYIKIRELIHQRREKYIIEQGYLAHGDLTSSHVFVYKGKYSGIIDFSDKMSVDQVWDLATFSLTNPYLCKSVLKGWIEQMEHEDHEVDLKEDKLIDRINFFKIIIALLKGVWICKNVGKSASNKYILYLRNIS